MSSFDYRAGSVAAPFGGKCADCVAGSPLLSGEVSVRRRRRGSRGGLPRRNSRSHRRLSIGLIAGSPAVDCRRRFGADRGAAGPAPERAAAFPGRARNRANGSSGYHRSSDFRSHARPSTRDGQGGRSLPSTPFTGEWNLSPPSNLEASLRGSSVAVSADLLGRLHAQVGSIIEVNARRLRISAVIRSEPDRLTLTPTPLPRILLAYPAAEATGLVRPRTTYYLRILFRLPRGTPPEAVRRSHWRRPSRAEKCWTICTRMHRQRQFFRNCRDLSAPSA